MTDLRLFKYELEVALQQNDWHVSKAMIQLAKLNSLHTQSEKMLKESQLKYETLAEVMRQKIQLRYDPTLHQASLDFLDTLTADIQRYQEKMNEIAAERIKVTHMLNHLQLRKETYLEHRKTCQSEFIVDAQNKQLSEIDRDWSARAMWSQRTVASR